MTTDPKRESVEKEADQFLQIAEDNIVAGQEEQSRNIIKDARNGKCPILL